MAPRPRLRGLACLLALFGGCGRAGESPGTPGAVDAGSAIAVSTASSGDAVPLPAPSASFRALVVDAHEDTPTKWLEAPFDLALRRSKGRGLVDLPRLREGDVDAAFFVAYVAAKYAGHGARARADEMLDAIHRMVDPHPELAAFATSVAEIRAIAATGRRAILLGVEGGHAIEDSLDVLRHFHARGVRYLTLTHFNTNHWADSSGGAALHHGLTRFGEDVVREMNRLGMMVDVSHASDETFFDVAAVTKAPLFASHSSARALCDHPRNLGDEQLRAVGKSHGVVMVTFVASYLECARPLPKVPLARLVDHIEHVAAVAGIDAVGLGSDFDNDVDFPVGAANADEVPKIAEELRRRGHSQADVDKVMGENFLRVFAETERLATH